MAMRTYKRAWAAAVFMLLSTGCTNLPDWSLFGPLPDDSPAAAAGSYSFAWRLSGDRRAGPLQVFDDGRNTWLQFAPAQTVPAIFAQTSHGDQLLRYRPQGQYVVLDGVWPVLMLRVGGLESRVERLAAGGSLQGPGSSPAQESDTLPDRVESPSNNGGDVPALSVSPHIGSVEHVATADAVAQVAPGNIELSTALSEPAAVALTAFTPTPVVAESALSAPEMVSTPAYRVSPQDGNIRLLLSRWANSSGWVFEPEHWAVDVDIPIVGSAAFELEFDAAVQQLLASTELSDRPLQPCFYANKVLRVVPYAQSCDRTMQRERV